MTNYRRIHTPGATWFFTVILAERNNNALLVDHVDQLKQAFRYVKERRPFLINATVMMPDHLHSIWTLPAGDTDYSTRWGWSSCPPRGYFSKYDNDSFIFEP